MDEYFCMQSLDGSGIRAEVSDLVAQGCEQSLWLRSTFSRFRLAGRKGRQNRVFRCVRKAFLRKYSMGVSVCRGFDMALGEEPMISNSRFTLLYIRTFNCVTSANLYRIQFLTDFAARGEIFCEHLGGLEFMV